MGSTKAKRAKQTKRPKAKRAKAKAKAKPFVKRMTDEQVVAWLRKQKKDDLCGPVVKLRRTFHDQGHKRSFLSFLELRAQEIKRRK